MHNTSQLTDDVTRTITDEMVIALGQSPRGVIGRALRPVCRLPARRFAKLMAGFDQRVGKDGPAEAARWLLSRFVDRVEVRGAEHIPAEGPLLVASNHPGAYDSLILVSNLPRRDLKVLASGVDVLRVLPNVARHLIYVTPDPHARMAAIRATIKHLDSGGAVLTFASGLVDPDPDVLPGAAEALEAWSPSLGVILRRAPQTRVVAAIVSGVAAPECLRSPLLRFARQEWEKRKLAEFIQISQQLAFGRRFDLRPRVTFGQPRAVDELLASKGGVMPSIIGQAKEVLENHMLQR